MPTEALVAGAFYLFAAVALAGGLGIILARSIFHSALFLIASLASVAAIFVVLNADFLAAVQILIYVGAITVLILFGIMLTPQTVPLPDLGGPLQRLAGGLLAGLVLVVAVAVLANTVWPRLSPEPTIAEPTASLVGRSLFTNFFLPFEVAALLLLVALVGAIVIAREGE